MKHMVAGLHQFLETEKHADGTSNNHHHGAHEIAFVPYGNRKANPHQHGDYTNSRSNTKNQFVEFIQDILP